MNNNNNNAVPNVSAEELLHIFLITCLGFKSELVGRMSCPSFPSSLQENIVMPQNRS
jgi:hypothetical protein